MSLGEKHRMFMALCMSKATCHATWRMCGMRVVVSCERVVVDGTFASTFFGGGVFPCAVVRHQTRNHRRIFTRRDAREAETMIDVLCLCESTVVTYIRHSILALAVGAGLVLKIARSILGQVWSGSIPNMSMLHVDMYIYYVCCSCLCV